MSFIGSPLYYILCGAALASLIIWLILLQKKPEKKTPPPPQPSKPKPTKPRYAAGSDIDKINRNARTVDFQNKPPKDSSMLIAFTAGALIFFILVFVIPNL